jgi:hypothetical protein
MPPPQGLEWGGMLFWPSGLLKINGWTRSDSVGRVHNSEYFLSIWPGLNGGKDDPYARIGIHEAQSLAVRVEKASRAKG